MAEIKKKSAQNPLPVIPFHPGCCNQNRIPSSWMIIVGFWARVFFELPFFHQPSLSMISQYPHILND